MVTRRCHQCGKDYETKPSQRLLYCGNACYHASKKGKHNAGLQKGVEVLAERSLQRRTKTCPRCGRKFVTKADWWHRQKTHCSKGCLHAEGQEKIAALLAQNKPLIETREDHVRCMICGKVLQQAGSHFTRIHGLDLDRQSTKTERQIAYGATQGTRMSSDKLRALYRQRAIEGDAARYFDGHRPPDAAKAGRAPPSPAQQNASRAPRSKKQMESFYKSVVYGDRHGAQVRKERAARQAPCVGCGVVVTYPAARKKGRVFCGTACASAWVGANQPGQTPEGRASVGRKVAAVRKSKYWSSREGPRWHKTITCLHCGKERTILKSQSRKYCSKNCYFAARKVRSK